MQGNSVPATSSPSRHVAARSQCTEALQESPCQASPGPGSASLRSATLMQDLFAGIKARASGPTRRARSIRPRPPPVTQVLISDANAMASMEANPSLCNGSESPAMSVSQGGFPATSLYNHILSLEETASTAMRETRYSSLSSGHGFTEPDAPETPDIRGMQQSGQEQTGGLVSSQLDGVEIQADTTQQQESQQTEERMQVDTSQQQETEKREEGVKLQAETQKEKGHKKGRKRRQKIKRKKLRGKVIRDLKPAKVLARIHPVTPKQSKEKKNQIRKRHHIQKPVKRNLNFDLENKVMEVGKESIVADANLPTVVDSTVPSIRVLEEYIQSPETLPARPRRELIHLHLKLLAKIRYMKGVTSLKSPTTPAPPSIREVIREKLKQRKRDYDSLQFSMEINGTTSFIPYFDFSKIHKRRRTKIGTATNYSSMKQMLAEPLSGEFGTIQDKMSSNNVQESLHTGCCLRAMVPYVDPMTDAVQKPNTDGCQADASGQQQNALIPYGEDSMMMVPYTGSLDPTKERRHRAKVDLDPDTDRVWKLLMGKEVIDEAGGSDIDKQKYWEEQKQVFSGRVDSFIARMNLVQGPRQFSPWKGSAVDSVVGVFLTQNVSDYLSSSAFMYLAARFPVQPTGENGKPNSENMIESTKQGNENTSAIHGHTKRQEEMLGPEEREQGFVVTHEDELKEDKEMSDSYITLGSNARGGFKIEELLVHGSTLQAGNETQEQVAPSSETDSQIESKHPSTFCQLHDFPNYGLLQTEKVVPTEERRIAQCDGEIQAQVQQHKVQPTCEYACKTFTDGKEVESYLKIEVRSPQKVLPETAKETSVPKDVKSETTESTIDWDSLRTEAYCNNANTKRSSDRLDSLDWEALRTAGVHEIAKTILKRGMNNVLAQRIKDFLDRLVRDHGRIDLEWLRNVPPDKTKEYLLSIRGLGLKSVECIRLLALEQHAFPVDTNVGRICVRLGWVPLQPLPESIQLHLLDEYPMLENIQKYLWPRLCTLGQRKLYELHCHMITFGKVFCTKRRPNCNACPMRGECKHFASEYASARLMLPRPEDKDLVRSAVPVMAQNSFDRGFIPLPVPRLQGIELSQGSLFSNHEPIIEEPVTPELPEPEYIETAEFDIEDFGDPDEIPFIDLNEDRKNLAENILDYIKAKNMEVQYGDLSKAIIAITPQAASIPRPILKSVGRLRTEHHVYELPNEHILLKGVDKREAIDPYPYLLAIWSPGETAESTQPPEPCCNSQDLGKLCDSKICFTCNAVREDKDQIVRGTLLIPCRTAMRGSFPLNGTYFQVNEVFADHASSYKPICIPREWIWNLRRRIVYFGVSISAIFRGMSLEAIQQCFWNGYVCVRGFDRETRRPMPLANRFHIAAHKASKKGTRSRRAVHSEHSPKIKQGPNLEE